MDAFKEFGALSHIPRDQMLPIANERGNHPDDPDKHVKQWEGALHNAKPAKCDELAWYPFTALPPNAIPYFRQALTGYQQGQS